MVSVWSPAPAGRLWVTLEATVLLEQTEPASSLQTPAAPLA